MHNVILKNYWQKDLIITLEYIDGSEVVFDRYYKEIEENQWQFLRYFEENQLIVNKCKIM